MAKKNTFDGATMSYTIVNTYFPVNLNYPNFDHFVFQQMIIDGSKADDDYSLIVYAVNADGTVLSSYELPVLSANSVTAKQKVQFANMKLDLNGLQTLYPPTTPPVTSAISVYPTKYYNGGNYVVYTAETVLSTRPLVKINVTLNPSPPY